MYHGFLGMKVRESGKRTTCARRENESKNCLDRKFFNTCTEIPSELVRASLIGRKENVQQVA